MNWSEDERCLDDILRETDFNDPFFDLDLIEIPKYNYNPKTPIEKINGDLKKFGNNFTIGHLNSRSLNKNFIELKYVLDNTEFDAFAVSESWLTKNTPKSRYFLDNFQIFRCDRANKRGVESVYMLENIILVKKFIFLTQTIWQRCFGLK